MIWGLARYAEFDPSGKVEPVVPLQHAEGPAYYMVIRRTEEFTERDMRLLEQLFVMDTS
jgi:hypothetical protein